MQSRVCMPIFQLLSAEFTTVDKNLKNTSGQYIWDVFTCFHPLIIAGKYNTYIPWNYLVKAVCQPLRGGKSAERNQPRQAREMSVTLGAGDGSRRGAHCERDDVLAPHSASWCVQPSPGLPAAWGQAVWRGARRPVPVCHSVGSQAKPDRLRARLSAAGPSPRFWVDSLGHEAGLQLGVRGLGVHVTHRRRRSAGPISKRNDREGGSRPPSAALAVPSRDRGVSRRADARLALSSPAKWQSQT